jgi:hypothetical protein
MFARLAGGELALDGLEIVRERVKGHHLFRWIPNGHLTADASVRI